MPEFGKDESSVLATCLHPEKLIAIVSETKLSPKIVLDIVRTLVHYQMIKVLNSDFKKLQMFDVDALDEYYFQATHKGILFWEEYNKKKK